MGDQVKNVDTNGVLEPCTHRPCNSMGIGKEQKDINVSILEQ